MENGCVFVFQALPREVSPDRVGTRSSRGSEGGTRRSGRGDAGTLVLGAGTLVLIAGTSAGRTWLSWSAPPDAPSP